MKNFSDLAVALHEIKKLNNSFDDAKLLHNIAQIKIPARLAELARLAGNGI